MSGYLSATAGRFTFTEFLDGENDFSGNRLTGVPNHTLAAGFGLVHTSGIYGSIDFLAKGRLPANDANSVYANNYETIHARIGVRKQIVDRITIELAAGARNLLNEKYASMVQVNALAPPGQQPRYFYPGNPSELYIHLKLTYR